MTNAKSRSFKLWESIEQQHLQFFERSRKEIESRLEDDRKTNDKRYEEIGKRFEESRVKFEVALAEMRQLNFRLSTAELNWKDERNLLEERVNADRRATETRLEADRIAAEARLAADRLAADTRLATDRLVADARLEKELAEFKSHKKWLILNFMAIMGILVAVAIFLMTAPHPPLFVS